MKRLSKALLAWLLLFNMLSLNPVVFAVDYVGLDLSASQTEYTAGTTGQMAVKGIDSSGGLTQVSTDVSFQSSQPSVAAVSSDGTVTAKKEGSTIITATLGELTQKVMVIVYNSIHHEERFDVSNATTLGTLAVFPDKTTFTVANSYGFDQTVKRSGNSSLRTDLILAPGSSDAEGALYNAGKRYRLPVLDHSANGVTERGILQVWFYDDMENKTDTELKQVGLEFASNSGSNYSGSDKMPDGIKDNPGNISWGNALREAGIKLNQTAGKYVFTESTYMSTNGFGTFTKTPVDRSKGWHQVIIDYSKDDTYAFYIDGQLLAQRTTPGYVSNAGVKVIYAMRFGTSRTLADGANHTLYLDDAVKFNVAMSAYAPVVNKAELTGAAMEDATLSVSCEIEDYNDDPLDDPEIEWWISDNGTDSWTSLGKSETYVCKSQDVGRYIKASVIPKSTVVPTTGERVDTAVKKVVTVSQPPTVQNVSINGTAAIGQLLTAEYTYVKKGEDEGISAFEWQRSDSLNGTYKAIDGAGGKTYLPVVADAGKYLKVKVTPVDVNGLSGEGVVSAGVQVSSAINYFVAPDGNDSNSGSIRQPFQTIQKARDIIRAGMAGGNLPKGQITVNLREGIYSLSETIAFDARDSGTEDNPVLYQAYQNETVRVMGGKFLDAKKAVPVTDQAILNRIIDPFAKTRLYQLDLAEQGITSLPQMPDYGQGISGVYQAMEIYINGKALIKARYPNNESGNAYLTLTALLSSNSTSKPFTISYEDPNNRTSLWDTAKMKDLYVSGYLGNDWASVTHKIASLDTEKKEITSVNGTSYAPAKGKRLFFINVLEEIDIPGESYIDRDTKRLYFYPNADLTTAEMSIALLETDLLTFDKTANVTLKGIQFDTTRGNAISISGGQNIMIDGCVVAHTSTGAIEMNGTGCTVQNCHIYDTGKGGVYMSGGDRKTLTPSNNRVYNNRIHSVDRVYPAYSPAISAGGTTGSMNPVIQNNKLYDSGHYLVALSTSNDTDFSYNEIYNAVTEASDMGAIYWGRNPSMLGIEIKYNYFHDIGNAYGGHGQQAVFWDDCATGPLMFGNIFYRATLTKDQDPDTQKSYAIKGNGGQYAVVKNNVFVDMPATGYFQQWNTGENDKQINWWLFVIDRHATKDGAVWKRLTDVAFDSDIWKNHYAGTQWAFLAETFSSDKYNEAKSLDRVTDAQALNAIATKYAPVKSNIFEDNIAIKIDKTGDVTFTGVAQNRNIYRSNNDPGFVAYGTDFKLTNQGLQTVRTVIPGFENIPTEKIGLRSEVGGKEPSVSNLKIEGANMVEGILTAKYDFFDPDGDPEGISEIMWYVSDTSQGTYTRIPGKRGSELLVAPEYLGKYIRYEVKPYDRNMLYSETVASEPVQIKENVTLEQEIQAAQEVYDQMTVGTGFGCFPQSAKDALLVAINKAKDVPANAGISVIAQEIGLLKTAVDQSKNQAVDEVTATDGDKQFVVQSILPKAKINIPSGISGASMTVPVGAAVGQITVQGFITVDGMERAASLFIPAGTVIRGSVGWDGKIDLFSQSSEASVSLNGTDIAAIKLASGKKLSFSQPVRFSIAGVAEKSFATISLGKLERKFSVLTEDSTQAAQKVLTTSIPVAKFILGSDMALWATGLEEIVFYKVTIVSPQPSPSIPVNTPGPIVSSGSIGSIGRPNSTPSPQPTQYIFSDTIGHWAQNDVEAMVKKGIVTGVTDTTFEPDRAITRAEFATLVAKSLHLTSTQTELFSDVSEQDWYTPYVNGVAGAGIIVGFDGKFRPNDPMTREEMAVVITKFFVFAGGSFTGQGGSNVFTDKDAISEWAHSSVDQAVSEKLLFGIKPDTFAPNNNTTRAQATAVLKRMLDQLNR